MSARPATITEVVSAFDAVIPGYAWAWHEANNPPAWHGRGDTTRGWRDRRRKRLQYGRDRCLLLYCIRREDKDIVIENRGYLPLLRARFPSTEKAVEELMVLATAYCQHRWREGHGTWFYNDGCDFAERTAITLRALGYIRQHSVEVRPLWQDGDLTKSS